MLILSSINALVSGIIGVITAIVSWMVLRKALGIKSPVLGICVGALTGLGLATQMGGAMSALLIPYEALGIAVVLLFLLMPFLNGKKKDKGEKPFKVVPLSSNKKESEDPWEREMRLKGKLAKQFRARRR